MKVPQQNSLLIPCVRQNNCPTPKSQCNADNAYSKARGYGQGLCIKNGEGATREQEHGWVLAALPSSSLMGHGYCPHCSELNHASMCDGHRDEGKHTAGTVNGMAGIWDNFFPRIWLEWGMAQFSLSQDCFSVLLSHHCKLQIHALLQHGERSSTNSSSTLPFSSFSRFIQIEHYFVSKLLRVLRSSKTTEIILNTVRACADENSEMQTNHWPVVSSTVWSRGCAAALTRPDSTPCILQLWASSWQSVLKRVCSLETTWDTFLWISSL